MATNCPQLLKPRACRSALCLRAAVSNPVREMSCKICEKMLHTLFKAESSSDSLVFVNSTYQRLSAFFFPASAHHSGANLDETEFFCLQFTHCVASFQQSLVSPTDTQIVSVSPFAATD